jgi:hypothetical protein
VQICVLLCCNNGYSYRTELEIICDKKANVLISIQNSKSLLTVIFAKRQKTQMMAELYGQKKKMFENYKKKLYYLRLWLFKSEK